MGVGCSLGSKDGLKDGDTLGRNVGFSLGARDGASLGVLVGCNEG